MALWQTCASCSCVSLSSSCCGWIIEWYINVTQLEMRSWSPSLSRYAPFFWSMRIPYEDEAETPAWSACGLFRYVPLVDRSVAYTRGGIAESACSSYRMQWIRRCLFEMIGSDQRKRLLMSTQIRGFIKLVVYQYSGLLPRQNSSFPRILIWWTFPIAS